MPPDLVNAHVILDPFSREVELPFSIKAEKASLLSACESDN